MSDPDFVVPDKLYVNVLCFLTFNFFAMIGSLLTSWLQWVCLLSESILLVVIKSNFFPFLFVFKQPRKEFLVIPVVLRVVFIPLFLLCNYQPSGVIRTMPIYISNDWIYWAIAAVMGISSGYLSSLGMMYAPQTVKAQYAVTAGMFAAAMLITGIFSGIMFSFAFPKIVSILTW